MKERLLSAFVEAIGIGIVMFIVGLAAHNSGKHDQCEDLNGLYTTERECIEFDNYVYEGDVKIKDLLNNKNKVRASPVYTDENFIKWLNTTT